MNWDQIRGNWNQAKGELKVKWAKLTDDDLELIEGHRDKLVGRLQELAYGLSHNRPLDVALADAFRPGLLLMLGRDLLSVSRLQTTVRQAVQHQRVKAGVGKHDVPHAARGGVALEDGLGVGAKAVEHGGRKV